MMLTDTYTVLWRELKEHLNATLRPGTMAAILIQVGVFGILPSALFRLAFVSTPAPIFYWLLLTLIASTGISLNGFAGERERHTLETLLASRLPDRAILIGKFAASVVYSLFLVLLSAFGGAIVVNVFYGDGALLFYPPIVGIGGLVLCVLMSGIVSSVGVLISLRAATVRDAAQKMSLGMLVLLAPLFLINAIPMEQRAALIQNVMAVNMASYILPAIAVLAVANAILMTIAARQFQRASLSNREAALAAQSDTQPAAKHPRGNQQHATENRAPSHPRPGGLSVLADRLPFLADIATMLWKEWREMMRQSGTQRSNVLTLVGLVVIFGGIFPLQHGQAWVTEGAALTWWIGIPFFMMSRRIADSFAGERERHTLETLLSTRLSSRTILLGKIAAPLLLVWGVTQIIMVLSLITVNLAAGTGSILVYPPTMILSGMVGGVLSGGFLATAGALISLRAATVQQAQQTLGIATFGIILTPMAVIFLVSLLLPDSAREALAASIAAGNLAVVGLIFAGVFALLDIGLLLLAMQRFQRAKLILD